MLLLATTLAGLGNCQISGVRWVDPQDNAWRGLNFNTMTSLSCELEWDESSLGPDTVS
jgi:hypothetical protein